MTKTKNIKRALLASVVSLLLCLAMLIGTTFAWFTDSAISSGNIIQTGNLDIEMYWANGTADPGSTSWTDASTGAIFNYDLWEPGYVEVRHIKIENKGSLALKYKVLIVANGEVSDLADVIDVYYFDPAVQVTDRTQLTAANKIGTLTEVLANLENTGSGALTAGNSDTITIALKMQEEAGNEYQGKSIGASFSIQILATQYTAETDSFGDQYDKDAEYINVSAPVAVPDNATAPITLVGKDVTVNIPAEVVNNLPAEVTSVSVKYTAPQVDANTGVVAFESVDLVDQNGNVIDLTNNTTPVAVVLPAQTALAGKDVVVMHDGVVVASTTVGADGAISYTANHFCEVTVVTATKVGTADELKAAVANGGNIQLAADIALSEILVINNDNTAIYGMGYKLTSTATRAINVSGANGVTINGLTIVASGERAINVIQNATNVTIVDVTATAANYTVNVASSAPNAVVAIKNSTLNGLCTVNVAAEGSKVTVDNSTVNCNDNNPTEGEAYAALSLNAEATGGSIIATNTIVNVAEGSDSIKGRNATTDGIVTINGSTDDVAVIVAVITYPGQSTYHSFLTLESAIEFAKATDTITLIRDITLDESITIDGTVKLDLNGYTISGTLSGTGNKDLFLVKGNMTVSNGTIELTVTENQGWNAMSTVFDITAGGVVTLDNVVAENKGGTDMNFVAHLNNWGTATLNVTNSTLKATYIAVRAFNSGYDMNNITIENTELAGKYCFWVHNYTSEGKDDSTLNVNIFGNGNTFTYTGSAPVLYGFDNSIYFNEEGKQLVTATTLAEVMAYAKKGNVIIDAQGANLGDFNYDGTFGNGTVLKNAKFTYVYGASVDGVATFENCEFASDHSYSANFSDGPYTGKVIFNNCTFDGWSSFGDAITGVEMNNCTFVWNNPFSILRFYQNAELNNCTFTAIEGIDTNKTGTVVNFNNCTGIDGKIYNNGTCVGTWIVDGTDISDTVTSW